MVNAGLRAYLWSKKPYEQKAMREVWTLNGATYEGYRNYIKKVKEQGYPQQPAPEPDSLQLSQPPSSQSVASEASPSLQATATSSSSSSSAASAAPPAGEPEREPGQPQPPYSFYHAFDVTKCAVSIVKFAPASSDLLAWGAADGVVYVATADSPPRLLQVLERHTDRVSDLDWSPDGTMLLSCSQDGTACLWQPLAGTLVRTLRNLNGALSCCRFYPDNPNLLLLGTAAGELLALNASTGHLVAKAELQAAPMACVGACCLEVAGLGRLLVADTRGCLHLFSSTLHCGMLQRLQQLAYFPPPNSRYHEPSCLEYVQYSPLAKGPAVLLVLSSGEVVFSRLADKPWRLEVQREVRTAQASAKVRASLCPSAALGRPEVLLCGGEDCRVHLIDISRKSESPHLLAALAAHSAPVLGVAWSADKSRLVTCDKRGVVVVWQAS